MIKVVTAKEMARIEQKAYADGFSEESFMNSAGAGVAELVQQCIAKYRVKPKILLLCGGGNNAGDAYVAGTLLREGSFYVNAISIVPYEKSSPLCQLQSKRFIASGGIIEYVHQAGHLNFDGSQILVDGLLGTGFHGQVEGLYRAIIEKANASGLPIVAVDLPSGINGTTGDVGGAAIKASDTLFLGLPKRGCFLGDAWNYVGKVHVFNFGLTENYINEAAEEFTLIDKSLIKKILPPIVRTRHKYQAGYVVGIGGSPGMPGAPMMSCFAALRSGAGIVRLMHPASMAAELAFSPYEVIKEGYEKPEEIAHEMGRASSIFIGPGMGTSEQAVELLKHVLPKVICPCVIDADALTLLAKHPLPFPKNTILTPQKEEMKRLLGLEKIPPVAELLEHAQAFCEKQQVTLVLKGAPTFVLHPGQKPFVTSSGDPGMATAGSGDVLTGMIAAFLAETKNPLHAAILGVEIHAIAGEHAARKWTSYCMVATDIIKALPSAFFELIPGGAPT